VGHSSEVLRTLWATSTPDVQQEISVLWSYERNQSARLPAYSRTQEQKKTIGVSACAKPLRSCGASSGRCRRPWSRTRVRRGYRAPTNGPLVGPRRAADTVKGMSDDSRKGTAKAIPEDDRSE